MKNKIGQEVHSDTLKMALSRDGHEDKFPSAQSAHRGSVCVKAYFPIQLSTSRILLEFASFLPEWSGIYFSKAI